ncbi:MAG: hypothetical protein BYD32DRAFT_356225, partial [Podila humilis]
MYSYKLKKSGVRTQVCMDPNGMALIVSNTPHIHELDCIAIDGGYTQYIKKLVEDTSMTKK